MSVPIHRISSRASVTAAVIVTIDGPAGSGKSTTARGVARRLDYVYLDTGAMYRAAALAFLRADAAPTPDGAQSVLPDLRIDVQYDAGQMRVFLDGDEVTPRLRTQDVGRIVGEVATLRPIRTRMVEEQRRIGREKEATHGGVVVDGRDTGTVVFPEADLKIYMVADLDERARRRRSEYHEQGEEVSLAQVKEEIKERDARDRSRDIAPLRRADDAVSFDSTDFTIEEQIQFVVDHVKARETEGT